MDYTLSKYIALCESILKAGYSCMTIRDHLVTPDPDNHTVLLRHDVDRMPDDALNMAIAENKLGITSTYYFRDKPFVFNDKIIRRISDMGHEIGYHYESLSDAKGDYQKAIEMFSSSLQKFRSITDIDTISMHGRPFSGWDNRTLWEKYDYRDFNITGEAYLAINYANVKYLCDTGRTWDSHKYNIRDHVNSDFTSQIDTTDELIELIDKRQHKLLCISSHPNRWPTSFSRIAYSATTDILINTAKILIKSIYRPR